MGLVKSGLGYDWFGELTTLWNSLNSVLKVIRPTKHKQDCLRDYYWKKPKQRKIKQNIVFIYLWLI